jgi:hypothetical protein
MFQRVKIFSLAAVLGEPVLGHGGPASGFPPSLGEGLLKDKQGIQQTIFLCDMPYLNKPGFVVTCSEQCMPPYAVEHAGGPEPGHHAQQGQHGEVQQAGQGQRAREQHDETLRCVLGKSEQADNCYLEVLV